MRRQTKNQPFPSVEDEDDAWMGEAYFTYRPLSNLPTPPPSSRESSAVQSPKASLDDGEELQSKFRGPAIHLVNLIPSSASPLAVASVHLVQAMLSRANLPIETVALAVCILDSLDAKFARTWRVSCPLIDANPSSGPTSTSSKRHTMPPELLSSYHQRARQQQLHIDAVGPELIVLAALVIAAKFTDDLQEASHVYCNSWGRGSWSTEQLNTTERCIMERLGYRIMPLCDERLLTDAMVDMQLAARQHDGWRLETRQPTPPEAAAELGSKAVKNFDSVGLGVVTPALTPTSNRDGDSFFVPAHSRSKTTANIRELGLPSTVVEDTTRPALSTSATPKPGLY